MQIKKMADNSHQYDEGAISNTNTTGKHIDALEVESGSNNNARNDGATSVTFNQASSFSFIISLILYLLYMILAMTIFSREIFRVDQYEMLHGEGSSGRDLYETYMIIFLIANIIFIISTMIEICVWFAKSFVYLFAVYVISKIYGVNYNLVSILGQITFVFVCLFFVICVISNKSGSFVYMFCFVFALFFFILNEHSKPFKQKNKLWQYLVVILMKCTESYVYQMCFYRLLGVCVKQLVLVC